MRAAVNSSIDPDGRIIQAAGQNGKSTGSTTQISADGVESRLNQR